MGKNSTLADAGAPLPQYDSDSTLPTSSFSARQTKLSSASFPWRPSTTGTTVVDEDSQIHPGERFSAEHSISHVHLRKRKKGVVLGDDESADGTGRFQSTSAPDPRSHGSTHISSKLYFSYIGVSGKTERTRSALLISASRRSGGPTARKTQRHLTAFGMKLPPDLEDIRDFVLPVWITSAKVNDCYFTQDEAIGRVAELPFTGTNGLSVIAIEESQRTDTDNVP